MKLLKFALIGSLMSLLTGCTNSKNEFIKNNTDFVGAQTEKMIAALGNKAEGQYPRTLTPAGELKMTHSNDWTDGFFAGSLWYIYELTGDVKWKQKAEEWTLPLEKLKMHTNNHDIGFLMYCSFGNAYRFNLDNDEYKAILIQSAESALKRYNPVVKSIQSWNRAHSWDGETEWKFPVIIDNMMNLELLFWATKSTGDNRYHDVAVTHANTTLANHIRPDFSTYHVVNYDSESGELLHKGTAQGYADNSTWARGQAWAIYGYTVMYRETGNTDYLKAAIGLSDYFLNHPNLPSDKIPYWDFNIGDSNYTPGIKSYATQYKETKRDASAAAIICSALFELDGYAKDKNYKQTATEMLYNLASPAYRAPLGENGNFLLMHCVGSIPHKSEIDVPLVYADYYFLEALKRYKETK